MEQFAINGHVVTASFDVQDNRCDPASGTGGIDVYAHLTVDGQPGYAVLFQNDDDGEQYMPRTIAAEGKAGGNEELFAALGGEYDDDIDMDDELAELLLPIAAAAQEAFNAKITEIVGAGTVVNADEVPENEAVPLHVPMGYWVGGWGFSCDGDGYISVGRAEVDAREWRRYRIGAELAAQLEEIADETSTDDAARTARVIELLDAKMSGQSGARITP